MCRAQRAAGFQFLIGRLDTQEPGLSGLAGGTFQFLIGRLDTVLHGTHMPSMWEFQFLIGRLDTLKRRAAEREAEIGFNSS